MRIEDTPAYREIMLAAYAEHPAAFGSTVAERAAQPLEWWEKRVHSDTGGVVIGVFADRELAGVVGVSFERREKMRHKSRLYGMYVRPSARGRGVGGALVRAALEQAEAHPFCRVMQLTVVESNAEARALYERWGFTSFGVEPLAMKVGDAFHGHVHLWREIRRDEE